MQTTDPEKARRPESPITDQLREMKPSSACKLLHHSVKYNQKQSGFARDRADSVRIMRIEQRQKKNDALLAERIIQMAEIKPLMYGKGGADEKCIVTAYETGNLMCEVCRAVSSPDDWAINSLN